MAPDRHPMILSANITRGLGGKTSFSATVKNVFREPASLLGTFIVVSKISATIDSRQQKTCKWYVLLVALERRRDGSSKQYSVEAELLLNGVVGSKTLGVMEQRGSLWSSVLRLKYGLGGEVSFADGTGHFKLFIPQNTQSFKNRNIYFHQKLTNIADTPLFKALFLYCLDWFVMCLVAFMCLTFFLQTQ